MTVFAAIVGLGWWGRVLVESVRDSSGIVFTTAVVPDAERHRETAKALGLRLETDYDAILGDPSIDAVVLATPHSQHVDQIVRAAAAGKAVFSEKPLALDLASARRAVDACRATGVVLGIGTDKRFLPAMLAIEGLVREGALGSIVHVEGQYSNANSSTVATAEWRQRPSETPAGGMTGPGLHVLDAMINLAGSVRRADARFAVVQRSPVMVDSVVAGLDFASGATGSLVTVRGVPEFIRLQIIGTDGWAEMRDFGTLTFHLAGADSVIRKFPRDLAVGALLEHFAAAVVGERSFPVSTDAMLATVAALEAVITSVQTLRPVEVATTP